MKFVTDPLNAPPIAITGLIFGRNTPTISGKILVSNNTIERFQVASLAGSSLLKITRLYVTSIDIAITGYVALITKKKHTRTNTITGSFISNVSRMLSFTVSPKIKYPIIPVTPTIKIQQRYATDISLILNDVDGYDTETTGKINAASENDIRYNEKELKNPMPNRAGITVS